MLFIDARHIYRQIDRAHRDFTLQQTDFLASIVRLYRGGAIEVEEEVYDLLSENGLADGYVDVPGLCKATSKADIEAQGWSLNPGRYVGAAEREAEDVDFTERLEELNEELEVLNSEARELEEQIAENVGVILEAAS